MRNIENSFKNKDIKFFTIYAKEGKLITGYNRYLCKLKDEVTYEDFIDFAENLESASFSNEIISVFSDILEKDVIDFSLFFDFLRINNIDIKDILNNITMFLDMFNFGNLTYKSCENFGLDYMCAIKAVFGNLKEDRRLLNEYNSACSNTNILELINYDIDSKVLDDISNERTEKSVERKKVIVKNNK